MIIGFDTPGLRYRLTGQISRCDTDIVCVNNSVQYGGKTCGNSKGWGQNAFGKIRRKNR